MSRLENCQAFIPEVGVEPQSQSQGEGRGEGNNPEIIVSEETDNTDR